MENLMIVVDIKSEGGEMVSFKVSLGGDIQTSSQKKACARIARVIFNEIQKMHEETEFINKEIAEFEEFEKKEVNSDEN